MKKFVTMDWSGKPITTDGDGKILPRNAENLLNGRYYPTGEDGEWPVDPETGEKLEIEPFNDLSEPYGYKRQGRALVIFCGVLILILLVLI